LFVTAVFTFFATAFFATAFFVFFPTTAGDATAGEASRPNSDTGAKQEASARESVICHTLPIEWLSSKAMPGDGRVV